MSTSSQTTNFSEIAAGFLTGLNGLSPLVKGMLESRDNEPPPIVMIKLKNPDKKVIVYPGKIPMVTIPENGGPEPEMTITADAEMLHYMIWGLIPIAKGLNDKLFLVENNKSSSPEDSPMGGMTGGPLLFKNFLYEMYLLRLGANDLFVKNFKPEIPLPGEERPLKPIKLDPVPKRSLLGAMTNAGFYLTGLPLGLLLRVLVKWEPKEDLEAPVEYSDIPDPLPPLPTPTSGVLLAIMKFLFKRIDVFAAMSSMTKGAMLTGPFKF